MQLSIIYLCLLLFINGKKIETTITNTLDAKITTGGSCETQGGVCADITKNGCSIDFKSSLCPGAINIRCCVGDLVPVDELADKCIYTVKSGDTLSQIASQASTTISTILKNNIIPNINLIYPQQRFVLCGVRKQKQACSVTERGVGGQSISFDGVCHTQSGCESQFGVYSSSPTCPYSTGCCLRATSAQVVLPNQFKLGSAVQLAEIWQGVSSIKYPVGSAVKVYTKNLIQDPNFLVNIMKMVNLKGTALLEMNENSEQTAVGLDWLVGKALGEVGGEIAKLAKLAGAGAVVVTAAIGNCVVGEKGNVYAWSFEPQPGFSVEKNTKVGVTMRTVEERMRNTIRVKLMKQAGLFALCDFSCSSANYKLIEFQAHLYLAPYNLPLAKMTSLEAKMKLLDDTPSADSISISPWIRSGHTEFFAVERLQAVAAIQLATITSGCPCLPVSTYIRFD